MFNYHWIDTLNRSSGLVYFVAIPLVQCEIYLHVSTWLLTWLFILEEKLNRIALLHYFIEPFRLFQINCKISAVCVVQALCCATIQDIKLTWLILLGSVSGNTQLTLLLTCYFLLLVQQWSHRYGGSWKPGDNMYMTARHMWSNTHIWTDAATCVTCTCILLRFVAAMLFSQRKQDRSGGSEEAERGGTPWRLLI